MNFTRVVAVLATVAWARHRAHLLVLLDLEATLGLVQVNSDENGRGSDLGGAIGQESRFVHHVSQKFSGGVTNLEIEA